MLSLALLLPALAAAAEANPTTIDQLFARLEAAGAKTKAEVLAALPDEMKRNYVLIRDSRSRQMGTPDLPRILHFTKNAELIASSSGHGTDEDFAANDLEVMELDREHGTWKMAMIHFDGQKLAQPVINARICLACHGESPRPLWGEYHDWPTAYGGDPVNGTEVMGKKEREDFLSFIERAKTHEGYRHLELAVTGQSYELPGSVYGLPNTVLTSRIGMRQAEAIFTRLSRAPAYPRLRLALVAASRGFCPNRFGFDAWIGDLYAQRLANDPAFSKQWSNVPAQLTVTKILRLLGSDTKADFSLDHLPRGGFPDPSEEQVLNWNLGGDYLISMVSFLVLREAWSTDPEVQRLFALRGGELSTAFGLAFASSETLRSLDRQETSREYMSSLFPYVETNVFDAVFGDAALREPACDYFARAR